MGATLVMRQSQSSEIDEAEFWQRTRERLQVVIGSSKKKSRLSEVNGIVHHLPVTIQTLKYHQQVPRETLIVML